MHICALPGWWTRFRQRIAVGTIRSCEVCGITYALHRGTGWVPRTALDRAKKRVLAGDQPVGGVNAGLLNGAELVDLSAFERRWGMA